MADMKKKIRNILLVIIFIALFIPKNFRICL